jgi:hypothetical protein
MIPGSIHCLRLEADTLSGDVRRAFDRAAEVAHALEDVGDAAADAAEQDAFRNVGPAVLRSRAGRLRGAALHAMSLAAELAVQAGRLEQIASVRLMAEDDRADEDLIDRV